MSWKEGGKGDSIRSNEWYHRLSILSLAQFTIQELPVPTKIIPDHGTQVPVRTIHNQPLTRPRPPTSGRSSGNKKEKGKKKKAKARFRDRTGDLSHTKIFSVHWGNFSRSDNHTTRPTGPIDWPLAGDWEFCSFVLFCSVYKERGV